VIILILGVFVKLREANINVTMSIRPFVRMEKLEFHRTDFDEMWYLSFFQEFVIKIQVLLKSDKISRYFRGRRFHIMTTFRWIFL
jgi:hypothetical protein